jgi:hypothetical protein
MEKLELEIIETKNKVFVKQYSSKDRWTHHPLEPYFFDGKHPKPSFDPYWYIADKIPEKIEKEVRQPDINHRYELIDPEMKSDKFPLVFQQEDVAEYKDYSWTFKDEFSRLRSLYKAVSDPQPNVMEEVKFEIVAQVKIDEVDEYKGFSFPVYKGRWKSDGEKEITEKNARHQLLDRLVFPDLILPTRPCKLTSKQTFDIIRKHVIENINGKYAKVTSDYDFCFVVKKVIPLAETIEYTVDVNAFHSRRKPKYQKRYQNTREIQIFEMTSAEHKYKGYTIIEPFVGDNEEELGENIRKYLKGLMDYINEPLKECKHCKGKGVILEDCNKTTKDN